MLVVTELFNTVVNGIHAKKSVHHSRALVVTELVVSGTQCKVKINWSESKIYLSQTSRGVLRY